MENKREPKDNMLIKFASLQHQIAQLEASEARLGNTINTYRDAFLRSETERSKLEAIISAIGDGITIHDTNFQIIYQNQAFKDLIGDHTGKYCYNAYQQKDKICDECPLEMSFKNGKAHKAEKNVMIKDELVHVEITASPVRNKSGEIIAGIEVIRDITRRKKIETELKEQREFTENLIRNSAVPTFVIDPSHKVLYWNKACELLTGMKASDMIGTDDHWKSFYEHKRPCLADIIISNREEVLSEYYNVFGKSTLIENGLHAEGWYHNLGGKERYIMFEAAPICDDQGELIAAIETLEDITDRKRMEEELCQKEFHLKHMAHHDILTGLPNRLLFNDRMKQALSSARRYNEQVAVLFLDLDNFKCINDEFGHDIGDLILKSVSERLKSCLRVCDTIARLGGDEFIIMLENVEKAENVALIAQKILCSLSESVLINNRNFHVTTSVGISLYSKDGDDAETLVRNADLAMYHAKKSGKNKYRFFSPEMNIKKNDPI